MEMLVVLMTRQLVRMRSTAKMKSTTMSGGRRRVMGHGGDFLQAMASPLLDSEHVPPSFQNLFP